jgi:hypothetical protein
VLLILEIQVRSSIEVQADMSCGCVCQIVSPPLSRNTLRNSDTFFFLERGLCVSLAGEATGRSLHRGEVNETRYVVAANKKEVGGGGRNRHKYTRCQ